MNNHEDASIKLTFQGALLHAQTQPLPHGPCQWTRTVAASPFDVKSVWFRVTTGLQSIPRTCLLNRHLRYISIVRCTYERGKVTSTAQILHPPSPPLRTTTLRYVCAFEDGLPHGPAVPRPSKHNGNPVTFRAGATRSIA